MTDPDCQNGIPLFLKWNGFHQHWPEFRLTVKYASIYKYKTYPLLWERVSFLIWCIKQYKTNISDIFKSICCSVNLEAVIPYEDQIQLITITKCAKIKPKIFMSNSHFFHSIYGSTKSQWTMGFHYFGLYSGKWHGLKCWLNLLAGILFELLLKRRVLLFNSETIQ